MNIELGGGSGDGRKIKNGMAKKWKIFSAE
jgi:hypothetical protein